MAWKIVSKYNLGVDINTKEFFFYFHLEGEAGVRQLSVSPLEFIALSDMFRNEKPIGFNTERSFFSTQGEPVGEAEK